MPHHPLPDIPYIKLATSDSLNVRGGGGRERPEEAMDRDFFMTAQKAQQFGLIDEVIERRKAIPSS
eukprot:4483447-Pyramimonas_sp.AAC.1